MADDIFQTIQNQIQKDRIVLYMKGTPLMPQCGFSQKVTLALKAVGAKFATYNVLEDPMLREGIKQFSNWPTIPQLYVDGEFVGGCDITLAMYESGELEKLVAGQPAAAQAH
jgi:monothiol glutaredoxin